MYYTLIIFHSVIRWLLLVSLLLSVIRASRGYFFSLLFSKTDNAVRHWTATIAHIQLVIGIMLYTQSPVTQYFWQHFNKAIRHLDETFFSVIHITLMLIAIVLITIGSALAKRRLTDKEKFKTQLGWFSISLIIIFIAVPWPFSPLASRPYLR